MAKSADVADDLLYSSLESSPNVELVSNLKTEQLLTMDFVSQLIIATIVILVISVVLLTLFKNKVLSRSNSSEAVNLAVLAVRRISAGSVVYILKVGEERVLCVESNKNININKLSKDTNLSGLELDECTAVKE